MHVIYNSVMNLQAVRLNDNQLRAQTNLLTTDTEAVGWITTDIKGLIINDCQYAIYRSQKEAVGNYLVTELIGTEAYLNSGAELKKALGGPGLELARELISECVRGAVQAETFFFTERGFADAKTYDRFWEDMYQGSCRYYSNLEQIDVTWMDYVGYTDRSYNLFNRSKQVTVSETDSGLWVHASFIDSFHELALQIVMDSTGQVREAQGNFLRAPNRICWENSAHLENLVGHHLGTINKREIAAFAGGSQGCNHLVDLLFEAAKAIAHIKLA